MTSLLQHFATAVELHPNKIAIVDGKGRQTSFVQLHARAADLASYWRSKDVQKGDRVMIAMPLDADLFACLAALWSLGAIAVLPEPAMGLAGLRHAIATTKTKAFCASGFYTILKYILPELRSSKLLRTNAKASEHTETCKLNDYDVALISFTSGTTGKPKAIPRSHGFLMAQYKAIKPLLHSENPERDLVTFPVFTLINIASGQTSVLPNWKIGNLEKLTPKQLNSWIETQSISRALLPPSLCEKLAQDKISSKLHTIFTGGGPVFPDILEGLRLGQDQLRVVCVYGSTEAEPIAYIDASKISDADKEAMASGLGLLVGYPIDDILVRIKDDEIQVAGAHVNQGYLDPAHDENNKIKDGEIIWHRTGDAGTFDGDGRLWLWGRFGSEVTANGKTLFPFAIEVAARHWLGLHRCALMLHEDHAVLVVQGDEKHKLIWQENAKTFDIFDIKVVDAIPMDARHGSKIDRVALMRLLR